MQNWAVQDANAWFSEFLDAYLVEGPQMITRRVARATVHVPAGQWHRLQLAARPSLKQLLLSEEARGKILLPKRGRTQRRPTDSMR